MWIRGIIMTRLIISGEANGSTCRVREDQLLIRFYTKSVAWRLLKDCTDKIIWILPNTQALGLMERGRERQKERETKTTQSNSTYITSSELEWLVTRCQLWSGWRYIFLHKRVQWIWSSPVWRTPLIAFITGISLSFNESRWIAIRAALKWKFHGDVTKLNRFSAFLE